MGKKKKHKQKKSIFNPKQLLINLIILILGSVITFEVFKWIYPHYTMVESEYVTNRFRQINGRREIYPVILNDNSQICLTLRNDNSRSIHIKKISVNVYGYEDIREYEDKNENGIGGVEEPILLKADIRPEKGQYDAVIDSMDERVEYIALEAGEIDIYLLALTTVKEGLYDINVEFIYTYGKKTYCAKTERQKLVIEENMFNVPSQ